MTRAVGVKRQNTLENTGVLCSALVKMTCRTPVNKMLNYLGDFLGGLDVIKVILLIKVQYMYCCIADEHI